jgi:hypothetical protein
MAKANPFKVSGKKPAKKSRRKRGASLYIIDAAPKIVSKARIKKL